MLLSVAVSLVSVRLRRGVKFCFQPAEENANNGALSMILDNTDYDILLSDPPVVNCFGIHLASDLPLNLLGYKPGPFTANSDKWEVHIKGVGGHCISPE
jgi:metal-dependent amidase/aminoacylase/carboxypeptidase family protein